jgi:outer membrane protein OmpA-like peptidoglycan-associated protein
VFLVALALSGCATQDALNQQSQSMRSVQDRLDRLEQAIRTADAGSQARTAALGQEAAALRDALKTLGERTGQTEAGLDRLARSQREALDQTADGQRRLAERVAQSELRLDELATTLPERLGQTEQRVDGLSAAVKEAMAQAAQENIRLNGREAFTTLLTEDKTLYPINSPELGGQDAGKLDALVAELARLGQDYHLEIQGHADNIGPDDYNYAMARGRAEAVARYLHERKGIPLSRMSVISYGAGQPLDRSGTNNRRIVVRALVAQ